MRQLTGRLAITLAAAAVALPAFAAADGVVKVNGVAIPKARVDMLVAEQRAKGTADSEQLRNTIKEILVRQEVLSQAARKKGLDKNPTVQAQMEMARQGVLIQAYLQDYIKANPVSDADVQKEYDAIRAQVGDKEYHARHILVDKEEDAKAIIARLDKGEKFEDLAKQSKDAGSRERGGDLGWANPASFVKPFSDAMVKLEKGKYTATPVKSDFGYHVIRLEEVRPTKVPPLEEVKPQLKQRIEQQRVERHMMDLRSKAKVE